MMNEILVKSEETISQSDLRKLFASQQSNQYKIAGTVAKERRKKLKALHQVILAHRQEIREALFQDYRKHPSEVDLTEIYPVTGEIKHAVAQLGKWMRPSKVDTPLSLLGSSSYIHYEPQGVVLIISPWNFPFNLTFGPLVSAIAAGNCVVIKPSEFTPRTAAMMKKIVNEVFDPAEVEVVEGGVEKAQELLKLPFNHIFFTGAPSIGKIVMTAAAQHLTSVTLELGGKSPTIIDESANLNKAAMRVAWAKYMNNGQVCIAPDYVYVHEKVKEQFLSALKTQLERFYGMQANTSSDYNRMVNNRHFQRVKNYLDDALSKGATVAIGGSTIEDENFISPTVLTDVPGHSLVMQEEIFGPLLPVYGFSHLEEPMKMINQKEKPLALYIYSRSRKNIRRIINQTRAGATVINHSAIHFFNNELPFGGSNNSGIGKGHGYHGFLAFSNARAVLKQWSGLSAVDFMMPPYSGFKQKLIDLSIKWF